MTRLFVLGLLFVITACGFQPLYGQYGATAQTLNQIEIATIPERNGQILRNALIDHLYKDGGPNNPTYTLRVSNISKDAKGIGLDKSSTADTRIQLIMESRMVLIDNKTKKAVLERTPRVFVAYNVLESQFTTIVTRKDAEDRALRQLADQMMTELALYFK